MMFRELFFPRMIGGKLLFAERTIGISIEGDTVYAAHIHASRNKKKIARFEQYHINEGEEKTYYQRLGSALKKAVQDIPRSALVRASCPSSKVVLKELTVPFLDVEKIRMVVEYEIESSIPFSLEQAVIDFIVIGQSEVKQTSTILVAAAQQDDVKKYVDTFTKAGITLQSLTIDTFALADLTQQIEPYSNNKDLLALIDIGDTTTRIVVMHHGMIATTRTIAKGTNLFTQLKTTKARQKAINVLFDEIAFTLSSFTLKEDDTAPIKTVLYRGIDEIFDDFTAFFVELFQFSCEKVSLDGVLTPHGVTSTIALPHTQWALYMGALGVAMSSATYSSFTLRKKAAALPLKQYYKKQLGTGFALLILIFAFLGMHGTLTMQALQKRINRKEQSILKKLRALLPQEKKARKKKSLVGLLKAVETCVQEQEEIWAPFARERLLPNLILLELSQLFNRKKYDITIESIQISGEETELHPIEVIGIFRSQNGSDHFAQFGTLEHDIKESEMLVLTEEIDPTLEDDGIRFIARFKQVEE